MKKEAKEGIVKGLVDILKRTRGGVVTNYQGIPTPELVNLRHRLRESGIEFRVIKNTLGKRAVNEAGKSFMAGHFDGPIALAVGFEDATAPAKAIAEYIKSGMNLQVVGGFLPDRWLTQSQVDSLASIPSREVLLSRMVAGLSGPIVGLVNSLSSPMLGLVWALQARINQMEAK